MPKVSTPRGPLAVMSTQYVLLVAAGIASEFQRWT